ncbi:hypothetical protein F5Y15DRAFT_121894 [Xylariaceae sp. FL0016]|nr:hypothetical protein F5Y15DRAFT_121894 [Xylariaceae sp. FL0016]
MTNMRDIRMALGAGITAAGLLTSTVSASPFLYTHDHGVTLPLPHRDVIQLSNPTWLENIAVRSNGDLLLTVLGYPEAAIYSVSGPASGAAPSLTTIGDFSSANYLLGIAEPAPDLFVVVGSATDAATNGTTWPAWRLDFRDRGGEPAIEVIGRIDDATVLNGVAALPENSDVVLVADSSGGLVWRLDITTGAYERAIQVPEMGFAANASSPTGVNGVKVCAGYLYWTNSYTQTIYRVGITRDGFAAEGAEVEMVGELDATFLDDFAIGDDGIIWAATDFDNRLFAVQPFGQNVVVEGGVTQFTLAGDTSAAFGRGETDKHILYVATNGALRVPINGTSEGGKVVAIDTQSFRF